MQTSNRGYQSPLARRTTIGLLAISLLAFAGILNAAQQTYFISGETRASSTFSGVPAATPFTGTYSFDDAAVDSNVDPTIGTYPTGMFFLDFGPSIGTITFDGTPSTVVKNDQPGFFSSSEDSFLITATPGARNTPGFSNAIQSLPSLLFRATTFSPAAPPSAVTDDSLTGVPQVYGAPWDAADQIITLQLSATPSGCPAFSSSCYLTLEIQAVDPAYNLTVTPVGDGSGTVVSNPEGIDCPGTCSALLGGTVVLTATPDEGSEFVGWTGCDSVMDTNCTVTLTGETTVTAEFATIPPPPAVPTLWGFGTAALALLLAIAGVFVLKH